MTMTFARLLSPKSLHWVRSVKRAIMAEPPLPPMTTDFVPPPKDAVVQGRVSVREQPPASPTLQAVALKQILILQDEVNRAQVHAASIWTKAETLERQLKEAQAASAKPDDPR